MRLDSSMLVALALSILVISCDGNGGSDGDDHPTSRTTLHGVNFSPFVDGQDPTLGDEPSEPQIRERLQTLRGRSNWIRTFGSTKGLDGQACIAREFGFKTAIGAWLDDDRTANETEITALTTAAHSGCVDVAIVGSETLLRGDLSAAELTGYVANVRERLAGLGIPVTTVERFQELRAHPEIIDAVDVVFANYYPFWEGVAIDDAIPILHDWHLQLKALAGSKPILVSETGWPDAGDSIGAAIPSPENANDYFLTFASWARAEAVEFFYFEAFDETWKTSQEGEVGAHWGIWDTTGALKPGRSAVFEGRTSPDTWSPRLIDGAGDPSIEFTRVSPIGERNGFANGRVAHVMSSAYKVAVYIRVRGGWWTKPFFNAPLVSIAPDGEWSADIVTGGVDEEADRVAAFLVSSDYPIPLCGPCSGLPNVLAVARVEMTRTER